MFTVDFLLKKDNSWIYYICRLRWMHRLLKNQELEIVDEDKNPVIEGRDSLSMCYIWNMED